MPHCNLRGVEFSNECDVKKNEGCMFGEYLRKIFPLFLNQQGMANFDFKNLIKVK